MLDAFQGLETQCHTRLIVARPVRMDADGIDRMGECGPLCNGVSWIVTSVWPLGSCAAEIGLLPSFPSFFPERSYSITYCCVGRNQNPAVGSTSSPLVVAHMSPMVKRSIPYHSCPQSDRAGANEAIVPWGNLTAEMAPGRAVKKLGAVRARTSMNLP